MASVDKAYSDWKHHYPPSHTSRTTASIAIDGDDPQQFVEDFIRMAERDYPNHQISGEVVVGKSDEVTGKLVFEPVTAP